ncbi:MAG TPA: hypothetical protein ENN67_01740, partial [Firmicutes bacterium]|nr:hypothetical protein [Bacillota bacterium]
MLLTLPSIVSAQDEPEPSVDATITETATENTVTVTEPEPPKFITLPAGTPLNLIMLEELYSQRNIEGDEILFALTEDVVFLGKTYLVAGTPVVGRVTACRAANSAQGGVVDIEIRTLIAPYGMPV